MSSLYNLQIALKCLKLFANPKVEPHPYKTNQTAYNGIFELYQYTGFT